MSILIECSALPYSLLSTGFCDSGVNLTPYINLHGASRGMLDRLEFPPPGARAGTWEASGAVSQIRAGAG
jgi:hypothetical protein